MSPGSSRVAWQIPSAGHALLGHVPSAEQCGDQQVFLGGLLIGGAEELQAALSDGSFKDALDGSNEPALPADLREAVDRTLAQHPAVRPAPQFGARQKHLLCLSAADRIPAAAFMLACAVAAWCQNHMHPVVPAL